MSNNCSVHPDCRIAELPADLFDVPALKKVVDWAKTAPCPSVLECEKLDRWELSTAWWWFYDITITDDKVIFDLDGQRSSHTFRSMRATVHLLGAYATEALIFHTYLTDTVNPGSPYEHMKYAIGTGSSQRRIPEEWLA